MLGSQLGVGAYRALVEKRLNGVMVSVSGQLELDYVPFDELVDPETLVTVVRYIELGSDFHRLTRFLETYVDDGQVASVETRRTGQLGKLAVDEASSRSALTNSPADPILRHGLVDRWRRSQVSPEVVLHAYIELTPFDRIKYELDKQTGYLRVDRPNRTSSFCPTLYGFVPRTYCGDHVAKLMPDAKAGDHDPLDICVISERPITNSEIILKARVVGGLAMLDNGEADDKIIAVLEKRQHVAGRPGRLRSAQGDGRPAAALLQHVQDADARRPTTVRRRTRTTASMRKRSSKRRSRITASTSASESSDQPTIPGSVGRPVGRVESRAITPSACPWCSARPSSAGRCSTAIRRARAVALKIASAMWWLLRP